MVDNWCGTRCVTDVTLEVVMVGLDSVTGMILDIETGVLDDVTGMVQYDVTGMAWCV
jgi:hypothetical protein